MIDSDLPLMEKAEDGSSGGYYLQVNEGHK